MFSLCKHLLVLLLFLICCVVVGLYDMAVFNQEIDFRLALFQPRSIPAPIMIAAASLVLVPVMLLFLVAPLFRITADRSRLGSFLRTILILFLITFTGYQIIDTRKVYQPYRESDLIVRHQDAGKASFLLSSLFEGSLGPIPEVMPLSNTVYYRDVETNRQAITSAWERSAPYRVVIEQLAALSALPHPIELDRSYATATNAAARLDAVSRIYLAQSYLLISSGNRTEGLDLLVKILHVARMGFAGAVHPREKMAWANTFTDGIRLCYWLVTNKTAHYEEARKLAVALPRLTWTEASLQRTWLAEYLSATANLGLTAELAVQLYQPAKPEKVPVLRFLPPPLRDICYRLTFQKNRTAASLRSFWQPIIETSPTNPAAFRETWQRQTAWITEPPLRNLSGWYYHRPPDFTDEEKLVANLVRISDLFAAYLQARLAVSGDISAFLDDDRRPVTVEGTRIIDAGDDGVTATDDDIVLEPLL